MASLPTNDTTGGAADGTAVGRSPAPMGRLDGSPLSRRQPASSNSASVPLSAEQPIIASSGCRRAADDLDLLPLLSPLFLDSFMQFKKLLDGR